MTWAESMGDRFRGALIWGAILSFVLPPCRLVLSGLRMLGDKCRRLQLCVYKQTCLQFEQFKDNELHSWTQNRFRVSRFGRMTSPAIVQCSMLGARCFVRPLMTTTMMLCTWGINAVATRYTLRGACRASLACRKTRNNHDQRVFCRECCQL